VSWHVGRVCALALLLIAASSAGARAQSENTVALGFNVGWNVAAEATASDSHLGGLIWRIGHSETGWDIAYGFSWFATHVKQPIGGLTTEIGVLHVRPILAGYGYTYVIGPAALSANLLGGFAFTSFRLRPTAADAYRDRLGARSVDVRFENTFVVKPEFELWLDITRKIGVNVNAGYMVARPRADFTSTLGTEVRRFRADMFMLKGGVVYSIF
jgi:hypothetical protein